MNYFNISRFSGLRMTSHYQSFRGFTSPPAEEPLCCGVGAGCCGSLRVREAESGAALCGNLTSLYESGGTSATRPV